MSGGAALNRRPFVLASIALIVIPGPNMIFIVTRTAAQGLQAGVASALGVEVETILHIAAAGLVVVKMVLSRPAVGSDLTPYGVSNSTLAEKASPQYAAQPTATPLEAVRR